MIYKAELLQLNLTYTVSICVLILKCQFDSLSQTRKKKIAKQTWSFVEFVSQSIFFFEFEIEKKSSDTRYFENQV